MYQWEKFENRWMRIQMLNTIVNVGLVLTAIYFIAKWKGFV